MKNLSLFMIMVCIFAVGFSSMSKLQILAQSEESQNTVVEVQCEKIEVTLEPNEKIEIDQGILNFGKELDDFDHIKIFNQGANLSGECNVNAEQKGFFFIIQKYEPRGNVISSEQSLDIEKFFVRTSFGISPSKNPDRLSLETNHLDLLTTELDQLRIYNLEGHRISRKKQSDIDDIVSVDIEGAIPVSKTGDSICFFLAQMYVENMSFDEEFVVEIRPFICFSLKNAYLSFIDENGVTVSSLYMNGNNIVGNLNDKVEWNDKEHKRFELPVDLAIISIGRFKASDDREKLRIRVDGQMAKELVPIIGIEKEFRKQEEGKFQGEFLEMIGSEKDYEFLEYDTIQIRIRMTNNIDQFLDIHVIDEQEDRGDIINGTNSEYFENVGPDKQKELFYAYRVKPLGSIEEEGKIFRNNKIIIYYRLVSEGNNFFRRIEINTDNTTIRSNPVKAEFERVGYTSGQLHLYSLEFFYLVYFAVLTPFLIYIAQHKWRYLHYWAYISLLPVLSAFVYTRIPFDPNSSKILIFFVLSGLSVFLFFVSRYKERLYAIASKILEALRSTGRNNPEGRQ
jgi:hypothetical protein